MKVGKDLNYKKKFEWKKEQTNQRSKIKKKTESGLFMLPQEERGKNCIAYQDKRRWREKMMKNGKEKESYLYLY